MPDFEMVDKTDKQNIADRREKERGSRPVALRTKYIGLKRPIFYRFVK